MTGNTASAPISPRYLLDESISRRIADALALVDVPIVTVRDQFKRAGTDDEDIVDWCGANNAVWIHADGAAYTKHTQRIRSSGTRTLWIQRPGGQMSRAELLRVIAVALPLVEQRFRENSMQLHYRVTAASPLHVPRLTTVKV